MLISISIFILGNIFYSNLKYAHKAVLRTKFETQISTQIPKIAEENITQNKATTEKQEENLSKWNLEIPSINLKAQIAEGTSKETMEKYIGHFEETSKTNGNIGLAAHNRGYENNYFENLKKLKEGEVIIYRYKEFTKEYIVKKHIIIQDTDWTNLEETEEDTITLITCVENQPQYRRCVQAISKQE